MARKIAPDNHVLTANRLRDGAVVFLDRHGRWNERIADAAVAADSHARTALLARGEADARAALVVGPYLVGVSGGVAPEPVELRERIRASGLTFRAIAADAVAWL